MDGKARRFCLASAVGGGLVWLGFLQVKDVAGEAAVFIERLLALAPLVLVPLGLRLWAVPDRPSPAESSLHRIARLLQPGAAVGVAASFLVPPGPAAALLASGWLAATGLFALTALGRLLARGFTRLEEAVIDAGFVALPIGAGWLVLSRLGATPLGFGEPIVLLTAVHFHYAGFATLVLTGLAGRVVVPSDGPLSAGLFKTAALGALAGTPLLAAGITFSHSLELLGALVLTASLWVLGAVALVVVRPRLAPAPARLLLVLSAAAPYATMIPAGLYAWGQFTGRPIIGLLQVARIHGSANALVFAGCGFLAWTLATGSRSRS